MSISFYSLLYKVFNQYFLIVFLLYLRSKLFKEIFLININKRKVDIMTRMDRSSGSIEGHFPVSANAEQPRIVKQSEKQAFSAKLKLLIHQAHNINERSCALHLKFALAALQSHLPINEQEP